MAKLAHGVRKKPDGGYEKRFTIDGQRYSVYGRSLKELSENEQARLEEIKQKIQPRKGAILLERYYENWQEGRKGNVKQSTRYTQDRQFKHIKKHLGSKRVQDITAADVKSFRTELQKKKDKKGEPLLSTHGVNLIMALLKTILNDAVRERIIPFNPCDSIKTLRPREGERNGKIDIHRALSVEETEIFFKYAQNSFYCPFFQFLLATGMRTGEAAALQWKDIDEVNRVIHIDKTVTRISDKEAKIGSPKTKAGKRDIPLNQTVKEILHRQKAQQRILFPNMKSLEDRIFTNTKGDYIMTYCTSSVIKSIIRRANREGDALEVFGAHAFRDTYITQLIESGVDPYTAGKLVGHSSNTVTGVYIKPELATMRTAAEKMDEILKRAIGL